MEKQPLVTAVFPSSDTLPANLLRFYIHFSQPMKTFGNLEHIKLLSETGEEIKNAIFNNVYELWDAEQQQLTIILDPARVKTGLKANEEFGRALTKGNTYQLSIEELEDIHHRKLAAPFVKKFYATTADTISPDFENWLIAPPPAQTKLSLNVHFLDIADHFSAQQRIRLTDEQNQPIAG
ncbi:MAG: hypothetical protein AAFQ37_08340, partial [Bacteroidota bacterium]